MARVINKVCAWAKPSHYLISNQYDNENNDIVHNSDKVVWLLDIDSDDSLLSLLNDSNTDVKGEEEFDREDGKTIYLAVSGVEVDDDPVDEISIWTIDHDIEEAKDIHVDCIYYTDWTQIFHSDGVILSDLANGREVGLYGPTLDSCVLTS